MDKQRDGANLSENQQGALDYIKNNKIDILFTEMLNNVVQSESKEPIVHMIRYLSGLVYESDLQKENIKIDKVEQIEVSPIIREFYFPEETTHFLKKFIDPKVFDKLKSVKTSLGGHISHIIQTGLKVDNKEQVGIYATDGEAYTKFSPLFKPAISLLQDYDKNFSLYELPEERDIFSLGDHQSIKEKLSAIRFKYSRNLKGYPYIPYAKQHTKKEIKDKILNSLLNLKENENAQFFNLDDEKIKELENKFFDREENFFNSLGLSKEHAGILLSEDEKVAYLINYNDHLQVVVYDQTCDFRETYKRLTNIHDHISNELQFDYHSDFGYLTSCPSNVGQALKISAWLNIPNVVNQGNFLVCCKRWALKFKKNQSSFGHKGDNEIASKHKIGVPETSFVNAFIVKICSLINFENNLQVNLNYVEKPLEASKMKESLRSLYLTFFDKYKFVTTPNLKSFNSLFSFDYSKNQYSVLFVDKEAYFVFRNFVFDYITGFANINMVEVTSVENRQKLKTLYTETITEEQLKIFDDTIAEEKTNKNLERTSLILTRNIKENNFTEILPENTIKKNYEQFLILAKDLKANFEGTVLEESEMESLYESDFKFFYEEFNKLIKDKTANLVCAYVSKTDKTLVLFNGMNHIKFISISKDGTISSCYSEVMKLHDFIDAKISFEFDDIYGYLTTHPLNSGCAFEMRLSYENVSFEDFSKNAEKHDLTCTKILSTGSEVFNRNKINMSATLVVRKFLEFLNSS